MSKLNVHVAPVGTKVEDVLRSMRDDSRLKIVVWANDGQHYVIVMPDKERADLERRDSRFRGKDVAIVTKQQAMELRIL